MQEDFTSYNEDQDPNDNITVYNATHFKHHIVENENAWLYKDYGAGAFQYGEYKVDARVENDSGGAWGVFLMFSDFVADRKWLVDNDYNHITMIFTTAGIHIQKCVAGALTTDSYSVVEDDKWWSFTLEWNTTAIYAFIYNNTARTSDYLEDILSISAFSISFRYIIASNTRNRANVANVDLLIRHMDLGIADSESPAYNLMGLNSTLNASGIQLTINLTDNNELDFCLLEWNNSGSLTNVSMSISGENYLCLFNQTLHSTEGVRVEYKFYFNDTANNWNQTVQHFLITNTEPIIVVVTVNIPVLFIGASLLLGGFGFLVFYAKKKK